MPPIRTIAASPVRAPDVTTTRPASAPTRAPGAAAPTDVFEGARAPRQVTATPFVITTDTARRPTSVTFTVSRSALEASGCPVTEATGVRIPAPFVTQTDSAEISIVGDEVRIRVVGGIEANIWDTIPVPLQFALPGNRTATVTNVRAPEVILDLTAAHIAGLRESIKSQEALISILAQKLERVPSNDAALDLVSAQMIEAETRLFQLRREIGTNQRQIRDFPTTYRSTP